jgi:hypothetical protein
MGTNDKIAEAVVANEAVATVLSQTKPAYLYEGFAQKVSYKGTPVDYITNDKPIVAVDLDEAKLIFTERVGIAALKSDAVGKWTVKLQQVS